MWNNHCLSELVKYPLRLSASARSSNVPLAEASRAAKLRRIRRPSRQCRKLAPSRSSLKWSAGSTVLRLENWWTRCAKRMSYVHLAVESTLKNSQCIDHDVNVIHSVPRGPPSGRLVSLLRELLLYTMTVGLERTSRATQSTRPSDRRLLAVPRPCVRYQRRFYVLMGRFESGEEAI